MRINRLLLIFAAIAAVSCTKVYDLACEGLKDPLGIDSTAPHFSWKVAGRTQTLTAYRIQIASSIELLEQGGADIWDSGRVKSAESVMVPYAGPELHIADECFWRVRVWNGNGVPSAWSDPGRFSIGYIDGLSGDYIGAFAGTSESPEFCSSFEAEDGGEYFVHVNSLGYHELYINGVKAGDEVLAPAVSQLNRRSLIMTYDVTDMVHPGTNDIAVRAAQGWYRESTYGACYDGPLVKAQVDSRIPGSGWQTILATGPDWKVRHTGYSHPREWGAWQFGGDFMDAAMFGSTELFPVDTVSVADTIRAVPMMCHASRVVEELSAKSVRQIDIDSDLGREMLDMGVMPDDGKPLYLVDMEDYMIAMMDYEIPQMTPGSKVVAYYLDSEKSWSIYTYDIMTLAGEEGGERFSDHFAMHAFRYILFQGLDREPSLDIVKARRITSADLEDASSFECSDTDMNAIHDMIKYTLTNLTFCGYQVDCPHIERLGYGGDGNSSTMSTQTMFNAGPLYLNWLTAWDDTIEENGSLPHTAPNPYSAGGGPYWCGFPIMASYRSLLNYGDIRMVQRFYPLMKHWLQYVDAYTVDGLLRPWPDTDHRGWYLGDWIQPVIEDVQDPASIDLVNNCSLSQNYAALVQIAKALGKDDEAEGFEARRQALNKRIHEAFFHPDSLTYASGTQIDMAYPMLVGAVPEDLYPSVKASLLRICRDRYDEHIGAGLVGVPVLTEWAVANDDCDLMYRILKQPDFPGYLFMINNGAKTTWEYWSEDSRSRIHNCFNGIGTWFYQVLGGLVPDAPGYREFTVAPSTPAGVNWVNVTKDTPYGRIAVSWKRVGDVVRYTINVPCGTTARFVGNDGVLHVLKSGKYEF